MSYEAVIEVLAKGIVDIDYRTLLLSGSEAALSDYDLVPEEKSALGALTEDAIEALAFEVDERLRAVTPVPVPESELLNWREHIVRIELGGMDLTKLFEA